MKLLRQVVRDPLIRRLRDQERRLRELERKDVPQDLLERIEKLEGG